MHFSVLMLIASFFYLLLIFFLFIFKRKQKNIETTIYTYLLIITIFGVILDLSGIYAHMSLSKDSVIRWFIVKLYLLFLITYCYIITHYVFCLIKGNNDILKGKKNNISRYIYLVLLLINFLLPFEYFKDKNTVYVYGENCVYVYLVVFINILVWIITIIKNRKKIKLDKVKPILTFILFSIPVIFIQMNFPEMLLVTALASFITVFMYHTIENPDLKMIERLNRAKDIAEKSNRAKSDFLSSMSHEIRTPLNAIVGLSEDNLSYGDKLPKEVVENSKDIQNASQTLLEIVGNILDINKIESDKMEIVSVPYHFTKEITSLVKVTATRIGDKPINFSMSIAEDIPYELLGDKTHIKSVINNLLTNAIKYTEQGEIQFSVKCINKDDVCNLMIMVRDTGRGIKSEQITKLFDKFERLDVEKNTTTEGTGLGLAITKSLVEMMGGKINVQSQYGKGSMFVVNLPQKISKMYKPQNEEDLYNTSALLLKAEEANIDFSSMRLLIADDNKLNIKVARKALSSFNFNIDEVYDGKECVDRINAGYKYDLILMDIMMPNMSGESALRKLKEDPNFNTPVIALTADALAGSREKYMKEGFTDYLAKPFSRDQMKEKLDIIFKPVKKTEEEDRWKDAPTVIFGADSIEEVYQIHDK